MLIVEVDIAPDTHRTRELNRAHEYSSPWEPRCVDDPNPGPEQQARAHVNRATAALAAAEQHAAASGDRVAAELHLRAARAELAMRERWLRTVQAGRRP